MSQWTVINVTDSSAAQLLREAGYRVIEASSNEEACSMAEREGAELLLLQEDDAEQFRILADSAPALLWMNGPDGCEFVNRAYLEFLGVRDVDVRGFDWAQFVHPDDRKGYVTAYLESVVARRLFEATFRFRRHDGEYRRMKSVGTPRFGPDGGFLGYVGSTMDITDLPAPSHRKAEANHDETRAPRSWLAKLASVHPALLTGAALAAATLARVALTPVFGSGYTFITFYPAIMLGTVVGGWLYGMAATLVSAALCVILFIDPTANAEHATAILVFLGVNGTLILVADAAGRARRQAELQARLASAREDGLRDEIAARTKVEEELRHSQSQLNNVLETMTDGFQIIDRAWRFTYMNEAAKRMLREQGRDPDALIGQRVFDDAFPDDKDSPPSRRLHRVMTERIAVEFENLYEPWQRWYHVRAYPVQDNGIAVFFQDITERKNAEEAVREGQRQLAALLNATTTVVYQMDRDSRFVLVNRRFEELFGTTNAELRGKSVYDVFPKDIAAEFEANNRRVLAERRTVVYEETAPHPDGPHFYASVKAPLVDDEGEPVGIVGVSTDITERKRAEQALRESEARFRTMAEAVPSFLFETDAAGWNTWTSEGWCRFTGQTPDQVAGHGWADALHPEDSAANIDRWMQCMKNGVPFESQQRLRRTDGTYAWVIARALPVRDKQGRVTRWVGSVTDVDAIVHARDALRESEARLQLFIDHAPAAIAMFDRGMRYLAVSEQWKADYRLTVDPIGRSHYEVFPEIPERWKAVHRRGLAGEVLQADADPFLRVDGTTQYVKWEVRPWHGSDGEIDGILIATEDVTEGVLGEQTLRESEERLQQWNAELEQAVNEKTSELRQSQERLRALATELNLAEQRERKRFATELHDHLQQLLVFGKLTVGQGKKAAAAVPACEQVLKQVDGILSDALTYTRTLVAELSPPVLREHGLAAGLKWLTEYMSQREHKVTVVLPEGSDDLQLSEDHKVLLFQSVRELLINSSKHAGTGEAIVRMEQRDGLVRIDVHDDGVGFDLAAAAAAAADTTDGGISSKFGLFSIQERMRALGGSFDIQSTPGQGTTATLSLPLPPVGGTAARPEHAGLRTESSGQAVSPHSVLGTQSAALQKNALIRVLLVDDHIMVRQGLRAVLDAYADIELVAEAGDGGEAVRLVGECRPDVVVMDISMPRLNGIDATMQIKLRYPETIVIGLSVNAAGENQAAMARAGAVRLMTKEAAVEQLYDAIQEARRQSER